MTIHRPFTCENGHRDCSTHVYGRCTWPDAERCPHGYVIPDDATDAPGCDECVAERGAIMQAESVGH